MSNMKMFYNFVLKFWRCCTKLKKMSQFNSNAAFNKSHCGIVCSTPRSKKGKRKPKLQCRTRLSRDFNASKKRERESKFRCRKRTSRVSPRDGVNVNYTNSGDNFTGPADEFFIDTDDKDTLSSITVTDDDDDKNDATRDSVGLDSDDSLFTCSQIDMNSFEYDISLATAIVNGAIPPFSIGIENIHQEIEDYYIDRRNLGIPEHVEPSDEEIRSALVNGWDRGIENFEEYTVPPTSDNIIEPVVSHSKSQVVESEENRSIDDSALGTSDSSSSPEILVDRIEGSQNKIEESTQFDEISTIARIQDVTDVDTTTGIEPAEDTETNQTSIEESETAIKYKKQCDTIRKVSEEGIKNYVNKYSAKYINLYKSISRKQAHMTEKELNIKGEKLLLKCNPFNSIQLINILETLRKINKLLNGDKKGLRTLIRELVPRVCSDIFIKIFRVSPKKSDQLIKTLYPKPVCPFR